MTHHPPSPDTKESSLMAYITTKLKFNNYKYMVVFYQNWKKYDKIQLTEHKMDFNNLNLKNQPPSPAITA